MAKNNRGKLLYKLPSRARGTCPTCFATRTKLLYQVKKTDGTSIKVCKKCTHAEQSKIDAAQLVIYSFRRRNRKQFHSQYS